MSVDIKGMAAVRKKIDKLARDFPDEAGAALYQEGMGIWAAAVKRAPIEFGVLRTSAYATPPTKAGQNIGVEIGFGTTYAIDQHENTNYAHPRGGEAKYLQNAINERRAGMLPRLADRIKKNIEQGIKAPAIGAPIRPSVSKGSRRRKQSSPRVRRARKKLR